MIELFLRYLVLMYLEKNIRNLFYVFCGTKMLRTFIICTEVNTSLLLNCLGHFLLYFLG